MKHIPYITYLVPDYDQAIEYFTQTLGFLLLADQRLSEEKRWVIVRPSNNSGGLLLAKASNTLQKNQIGNQAGGRVFLFLHTDDFHRDYQAFKSRGVHFIEEPREEAYGTVAVFIDEFGTKWDLVEPNIS